MLDTGPRAVKVCRVRPLVFLATCVLVVGLPWCAVRSEPRTAPVAGVTLSPDLPPAGLEDLDLTLLDDSGPAAPPWSALRLRTAVSDREVNDLRTVIGKGEPWHVAGFSTVATAPASTARLRATGQLPYLPPPSRTEPGLLVEEPGTAGVLGFTGEMGDFELGAEYRSLGRRLERVVSAPADRRDREGTEVWMAQRFGLVKLRLSHAELSDNVDANPILPRTTRAQTAFGTELALDSWPVLGLSYATGETERVWLTPERQARGPERQTFESLTGSASYGGTGWDFTASSTYSLGQDVVQQENRTSALHHAVNLSLHLGESITLTPAVSAGDELYESSDERIATGSGSLSLLYDPRASRWRAWTAASVSMIRSSDGTVDAHSVGLGGGLARDIGKLLMTPSTLSLEAGYDQYVDGASPAGSSRDVFGLLRLKLGGF